MADPSTSLRNPDVSLCVAVWKRHGPPHVGTLGQDLAASLSAMRGEMVVVLNGIQQSRVPLVGDEHVVAFDVNRGVPAAWNAAAARARGSVLVFANDDLVLGSGALALLVQVLRTRPDAGVVGPVGTSWDLSKARHLSYVSTTGLASGTAVPCDVVSGFLMAVRREDFQAVGGFDECYSPCGFEEVDLCTTLRRRLGRTCFAVAGVDHHHEFAISAARRWRRVRWDGRSESLGSIARRNRARFLAKWTSEDESAVVR